MSYFRSVEMELCQMVLHQETAFDCLVELGYLGKVHFREFNGLSETNNEEEYALYVERCTQLQKIISRFYKELKKVGLKIFYDDPNIDRDYKPQINDLNEIENNLLEQNQELNDIIQHCMVFNDRCIELREQREVLLRANKFLISGNDTKDQTISQHSILSTVFPSNPTINLSSLYFLTGSAPVKTFAAFELMVWRVSRGTVHIEHEELKVIDQIGSTDRLDCLKYTFILVCIGDKMHKKLIKVCNGFGVKVYPCPVEDVERKELFNSIVMQLNDTEKIYMQDLKQKERILNVSMENLYIWHSKIDKIKSIYEVLEQFETMEELGNRKNKYLLAECWIPKRRISDVRKALIRGAQRGIDGDTKILVFPPILNVLKNENQHAPPTLFYTNKFTKVFQDIVNTYGIASYRELNPAPFSIITFPFFFAIMFADMGHGILLTVAAIGFICYKEKYMKLKRIKKEPNELLGMLIKGRYVILLMGVFSIYTGFLYNNIFSIATNIFASSWKVNFTYNEVESRDYHRLDPARSDNYVGVPYLCGLDPIWHTLAANSIKFNHSLKCKIAIIIGVFHMLFGFFLSAENAIYFNDKDELYLNFLPKIFFIFAVFVYLILLIFFKWLIFGAHKIPKYSPACAPSLFIDFLHMFLFLPPANVPDGCSKYIFENQANYQYILIMIAIFCILYLLCSVPLKTLISYRRAKLRKKNLKAHFSQYTQSTQRSSQEYEESKDEEQSDIKIFEIFFNQVFITAELVLGSISHVASYIRLWAISMAHNEIAFIVWDLLLRNILQTNQGYYKPLFISMGFGLFAIMTVIFLLIMEGLACFIHTMRLHFFDFQYLFYKAEGYQFAPFCFKSTKDI